MNHRSEAQGVGAGSVSYLMSEVRLGIGVVEVPVRVGWALIEEVPLLLGRLDVLWHFGVGFRAVENKIVLQPQQGA